MSNHNSYHSNVPEQENTHKNLAPEAQEKAVAQEMLPFAIYAAIPILITITVAFVFGVR